MRISLPVSSSSNSSRKAPKPSTRARARGEPIGRRVDAAAAEALVVAHHPRAAQRLEQVEDLLPLAEGVHERRAAGAAVLQEKAGQAGVVLQARELGQDDAQVLGPLGHRPGRRASRRRGRRPSCSSSSRGSRAGRCRASTRDRSCSRRSSRGCGGGSRRPASASRSVSPSSVTTMRKTPWVEGWWGPMETSSRSPWNSSVTARTWAPPAGEQRGSPVDAHGSGPPAAPAAARGRGCCALRLCKDVAVGRGLPLVVLGLHVVLAHRVVLEPVPHEDAAQVGVAREDDAVKVEDLALLEFAGAPDRRERRQRDPVGAVLRAHADDDRAVPELHRIEVVDDLEIARAQAALSFAR